MSLSQSRVARIEPALRRRVGAGEVAGAVALVARGDAIHVAIAGMQDLASAAPMRRDTIFRIASMTKPALAAAALLLVEEAAMALDEPIDQWLPELADRRVLARFDGPLDETVLAARSITLSDLLTFRMGLGAVMAPPGTTPLQGAMAELEVTPGVQQLPFGPDEYIARIGRLPLAHQPGTAWMYHTAIDVLAVLIARVSGKPLAEFLEERLFAPLDMADTAFFVPEAKRDRFASCYARDDDGRRILWDADYSRPPAFPNALVSTVDDYLAFARMIKRRGIGANGRVLARPTVLAMTTDQLTAEQKAASPAFSDGFWDSMGWGFGGAVVTRRTGIAANPGRFGWDGGARTSFIVDPAEDLVAIMMSQQLMTGPNDNAIGREIHTLAYQAIDD